MLFMFSRAVIRLTSIVSLFILLIVPANGAAVIDTSFGNNGRVTTALSQYEIVSDVLFHNDGGFTLVLGRSPYELARFNADGGADLTFGDQGIVRPGLPGTINSAVLLKNGKMLLAGGAPSPDGQSPSDFFLALHNYDGSLDDSFGDGGLVFIDQGSSDVFNAINIQADGKIIGIGTHNEGGPTGAAIRFTADGQLDTSYAEGGLFYYPLPPKPFGEIRSVFLDSVLLEDGRIIISSFRARNLPGGDSRHSLDLLALDSNGAIDTGFGNDGLATITEQFRGATNPDTVYIEKVGGKLLLSTGLGVIMADLNGNKTRKYTFGGGKTSVMPDGRILTSGSRYGNIKLFSDKALIGIANKNVEVNALFGFAAYAQPDGRILFVDESGSGSSSVTLTRIERITSRATSIGDLELDDITDLGYMSPTSGVGIEISSGGGIYRQFEPGTKIIPEFYEYTIGSGDRLTNLLVHWNDGVSLGMAPTYSITRNDSTFHIGFNWGLAQDIPTGGDFDGNGLSGFTVFRPGTGVWYSYPQRIVAWGAPDDKPVPADYDYDGITDYAVYRPSTGEWWVLKSGGGYFVVPFGLATDIPLAGDYDGDGLADLTVYRPSEGNWYQLLTTAGFRIIRFGLEDDIPVVGDFDGDGRHDIAVFRDGGEWHLLESTNGYRIAYWGQAGDIPITARYDQ